MDIRGKVVLGRENNEYACQVHGAAVRTGHRAERAEGRTVRSQRSGGDALWAPLWSSTFTLSVLCREVS